MNRELAAMAKIPAAMAELATHQVVRIFQVTKVKYAEVKTFFPALGCPLSSVSSTSRGMNPTNSKTGKGMIPGNPSPNNTPLPMDKPNRLQSGSRPDIFARNNVLPNTRNAQAATNKTNGR